MKIGSAAISFISLPSPKGSAFRGGPKKEKRRSLSFGKEEKRKSLSFGKVLSPIRRMGRQISKLSNRKSSTKDKKQQVSTSLQSRDDEQGWIAPATTFETEVSISPRSFDSLTTNDSASFSAQTKENAEEEELSFSSILDSPHQINNDQIFDLVGGLNESANTCMIFRMDNDVEDNANDNVNIQGNCDRLYAAPQVVTEILEGDNEEENGHEYPSIQDIVSTEQTSCSDDDEIASELECPRDSMVSLLFQIDTTEIIDETQEIDSLVPAADISFFLNEEDGDDFHCVGRLSTPDNEAPPVEIDVDSIDDLSKDSIPEDKNQELYIEEEDEISLEEQNQELYIEEDDEISLEEKNQELYIEEDDELSLSSYNSYLQAIESITASASNKVEKAITIAMSEIEIKSPPTPQHTPQYVKHLEPRLEFDGEDDYYCVSFNPSRELILQAMEGASAKAKADIEKATNLALSKMNSANSAALKSKSQTSTNYAPNRVLGFLFFIFLLFNFNGNSSKYLWGLRSISHSIGIDEFQIQPYSNPELEMPIAKANKTLVAMNDERFYNIGCVSKIGCLALGNI